jgi:hypothetical protein
MPDTRKARWHAAHRGLHVIFVHPLSYPIIPLVDARGGALGMVSSLDVIDSLAEMYPQEVLNLPPSPEDDYPPKEEGA